MLYTINYCTINNFLVIESAREGQVPPIQTFPEPVTTRYKQDNQIYIPTSVFRMYTIKILQFKFNLLIITSLIIVIICIAFVYRKVVQVYKVVNGNKL